MAITQKDCSARRESIGDIRNQEYTLAHICEIGLFFSGNKCEASYFFSNSVLGFGRCGESGMIKGHFTERLQLKDKSVVKIMEMGPKLNMEGS